MDLKELQKDPKMMEIMKEIGSIMQMRSKQEQAEKEQKRSQKRRHDRDAR